MGRKYIIEIPDDKIGDFIGSTHFLMPYMMAGHIGHHDTGLPIKPYTEPDLEQVKEEAYENGYKTAKVQCNIQAEKDLREVGERHYQKGLSDAWEAARKIAFKPEYAECVDDLVSMGFDVERYEGWSGAIESLFERYSASEAIEKIRQYEQEKEEQIQVGDEVINRNKTAVVTEITDRYVRIMYSDGSGYALFSEGMVKTGRHFPEIAEVLAKMKET